MIQHRHSCCVNYLLNCEVYAPFMQTEKTSFAYAGKRGSFWSVIKEINKKKLFSITEGNICKFENFFGRKKNVLYL